MYDNIDYTNSDGHIWASLATILDRISGDLYSHEGDHDTSMVEFRKARGNFTGDESRLTVGTGCTDIIMVFDLSYRHSIIPQSTLPAIWTSLSSPGI
jgi:hypothetical protein